MSVIITRGWHFLIKRRQHKVRIFVLPLFCYLVFLLLLFCIFGHYYPICKSRVPCISPCCGMKWGVIIFNFQLSTFNFQMFLFLWDEVRCNHFQFSIFNFQFSNVLVLLMKEHPVDGPIGLDREVAREYSRVVNTFTTPSFICWYGAILVLVWSEE